jgi:hypothetical protein
MSPADVNCTLSICNRSSDPECTNPDEFTFQEKTVSPYGVKTFTHVTDFTKGKEYVVTIRTADEDSPFYNDLKRYVFRTTSELFGTIKDGTSGEPLKRALVLVRGKWFLKVAFTDEKGFFEIDRLHNDGTYKISILKPGYHAVLGNSFQFDGSPVEENLYLQK